MALPLPQQALDLLNSLDPALTASDAMVDVVDVRSNDGGVSRDVIIRRRDGREHTVTLAEASGFEIRRGQRIHALFVNNTPILLHDPMTNGHLTPADDEASRKREALATTLAPLDIVRVVRSFATDQDLPGAGSHALRDLRSNIEKINAENAARNKPAHSRMSMILGGALLVALAIAGFALGYGWFDKAAAPTIRAGNPPQVAGPLVNYLDQVQLTIEDARPAAGPGAAPVCELVGSVYNRMGRKIDRMIFGARMGGTVVAFAIENVDKGSERRSVVIGRHPGVCLASYKDRFELSEPDCVFDGAVRKGCRDVIRIRF